MNLPYHLVYSFLSIDTKRIQAASARLAIIIHAHSAKNMVLRSASRKA